MKTLKKARYGAAGVFFGLLLCVLLTIIFDRSVRLIGLLGFFTALGSYAYTISVAICPKCSANFLYGSFRGYVGALSIMRLALGRSITCKECGHTVSKDDYR